MTAEIKDRLKNPALGLARQIAEARLKRAGVILGADLDSRSAKSGAKVTHETFSPALISKIAGG